MKKLIILFKILFILSFLSCSKNDEFSPSDIIKRPFSIKVKNSEGITWEEKFYYSDNRITKIIHDSGDSIKFIYDLNDRLVGIDYGYGGKVNYNYSGNQLSSIKYILQRGYTRDKYLFYNSFNQINKYIINENNEYENTYFFKYDANNRLVETINELGDSEKYEYDNANNPFKNVYPQKTVRGRFSIWIKGLKNNLIVDENLYGERLTYEYTYDSDNYPILIKEIGNDETPNYITIITYE